MRHKRLHVIILGVALIPAAILRSAPAITTEQEQITHVLNRIAFGPRPGDVEHVQQMGLKQYIEQQLQPERIDDSRVEQSLRDFVSLRMDNNDIMQHYPEPQRIAR